MTGEQRAALAAFRVVVDPLRLRVGADSEGWPMVFGRYGQIEWVDGDTMAIYSTTMRMLAKLTRIPGVRRYQIGDDEFRLLLPVDQSHDRTALRAVASLLRLRTRRVQSEAQKLTLLHGRRPFQMGNQFSHSHTPADGQGGGA